MSSKNQCEFISCNKNAVNHTLKQVGNFLTNINTCLEHNLELHNTWAIKK